MASFTPQGATEVAAKLGMSTQQAAVYLSKQMMRTDSTNTQRISQIMSKHGYPGKSLVSTPTNEAAFYVIQHSQLVKQYLPLVKQAAEKKELSFRLYAMMLDRQLMFDGNQQVYGTQARGYAVKDPTTGELQQKFFIWPVKNAAEVNQRRKQAGFEQTVEENTKRLGTTYRILTLEQAKKLLDK